MQKFDVGDTVQLTATAIFALNASKEGQAVVTELVRSGRTGGSVTAVADDAITIDVGLDEPLVVEGAGMTREMALQIVKKAEPPQPETPQPATAAPAATGGQQASPQSIPPFLGFGGCGHPEGAIPLLQILRGPNGDILHQSRPEQPLPQQVRLAQWVMNQFIGLKQYGIVQDLNRTMDADAPRVEHVSYDRKDVRAVAVELSATEESLYNTAMNKIGQWIAGDKPPAVRQVHPDMETADDIPVLPPQCGEDPAEPQTDHPEAE